MSEIDSGEEAFDYEYNEQDLEMAVAFEEQWTSSQAPPLFPLLDERPAHLSYPMTQSASAPAHYQPQQSYTQEASQVQDDTAELIQELKHKLYVQEHEKKELERKLRDSQDELENLNLKSKMQCISPEQSSTQIAKRAFPQTPPRPKSKIRKTNTPSQSWSPTLVSSEMANAMESIHLSSQQPSPAIRQPSSMQSPITSTQQYTPSTVKLETLSTRTIPLSVPGNQEIRSALPPRPPTSATRLNTPSATRSNAPTATRPNLKLLEVLFSDVYKETNTNKSSKLSMLLVPSKIPEFARLFCLKLKPADGTCSPFAQERLALLASDIQDIIERSENPSYTIPALLAQLGLCLPVCIEENLHGIIYIVSKVLRQLATFFTIAADQLAKEVKINWASSNIRSLVSALALYNFKKPPSMYYHVKQSPEIVQANSCEINLLAQKYCTKPREIAKSMEYVKAPAQAKETVRCILFVLSVVGASHYSKSTLSFLLTDSAFMNLLNIDTPMDVLEKACAVLILSMQDKQVVKADLATATQKPSFFVPQLCSLLSLKQPANYNHQWYSLCKKVMNLLGSIAALELPDPISFDNKKLVLSEVLAFLILCCDFDKSTKKTDHVADHIHIGLLDEETIVKLRNLVIFYVDTEDNDSHPAKAHLLGIEKMLDQVEA
ncbi:hypothetical protein PS6_009963 [Mucor atramentarius]